METLYRNPGFATRNLISMVVLIVICLYGLWEIWRAANGGGGEDGYIFGVIFVGGAIWGGRELLNEVRDRVMDLTRDPASGRTTVTLWRPFSTMRVEGPSDALTDWRLHVTLGRRNTRTYFIYVDHKDHPRPLVFDLMKRGLDLTGLKKIAPEAMAEFGKAAGQPG